MMVLRRAALAIILSLWTANVAAAACVSKECPDEAAVDSVRSLIAAACDCAGAKNHKAYVKCAKKVAKSAVAEGQLPSQCQKTAVRCEAHSTCGLRSAAVCCAVKGGKLKARMTKKGARCPGTSCEGAMSLVDACTIETQTPKCAPRRSRARVFSSVQKVFTASCALPTCHSTFARQGGLVLDSEDVSFASLINRPAVLAEAAQAGLVRVKPRDPENSFLIRKLRGQGPGDPMPQGTPPLSEPVIDMIEDWIRRGAHTTAEECPTLCGDDEGPLGDYVWAPEAPLEVPAPNEGIQLYTPPRDVTAGTEWETCYAFRPDWTTISAAVGGLTVIKEQVYRMHEGSHHLLLYLYNGQYPEQWATGYFPCSAASCTENNPNDCPPDARNRLPIGGTQVAGTRYEVKYPPGVGIPVLNQNSVLIANLHYTNPFQPPQPIYGEAWLNLYFHKPGEWKVLLNGIFAVNFNDLIVEPYETRTISEIWAPRSLLTREPANAAVFQLFGHMHKRGATFQIDVVKGGACSGSPADNPAPCGRDEDCACKPWEGNCTPGQTCVRQPGAEDSTIYYTEAWDHAPVVDFPAPYLPVSQGEALRWTCTHVNGVAGDPTRPPKVCHENCNSCGWDAATRTCRFCQTLARPGLYWDPTEQACFGGRNKLTDPPRVFAEGEPMPLVFGELADDDMCNMFGYFINQEDLAKIGTE